MRSCVTSTQSLTPISCPTYLCISFGWANSRFAISLTSAVIFALLLQGYHETQRCGPFLDTTSSPLVHVVILGHGRTDNGSQSRAICSDQVPFVSWLGFSRRANQQECT